MFNVQVGVHQGSAISLLLFIIVLEALSRESQIGCPREFLYAGDLVIIADIMDELLYKLDLWKKNLIVNMGKTKITNCSKNLHSLKDSGKHLVVRVIKGLIETESSVMDVNFGYTRNAVILKVD